METYIEGAKVFKVLGDPKRTMIVDMLSCGELCACDILGKFEMSQSTLSHHMKLLCKSGLVKSRDEGKWMYYFLDIDGIASAKKFFNSITTEKDNCFCKSDSDCYKDCELNV